MESSNPLDDAMRELAQSMGMNTSALSISSSTKSIEDGQELQDSPEEEEGELTANELRDIAMQQLNSSGTDNAETALLNASKRISKTQSRLNKTSKRRKSEVLPPSMSTSTTITPRVPCRYWMEGKCSKGDECTFSHAIKPNRTFEEAKSSQPCRYHMAGVCLKGDDCLYSHDLSSVPCRYFHLTGQCAASAVGAVCRFSHNPITEEEREQLLQDIRNTKDARLLHLVSDSQEDASGDFSGNVPSEHVASGFTPRARASPPRYRVDPVIEEMLPTVDPCIIENYNPFGSCFL